MVFLDTRQKAAAILEDQSLDARTTLTLRPPGGGFLFAQLPRSFTSLPRKFLQLRRMPMSARHQSFSQFLVGTTSLERPSFFYAYAGMWLHLIISVPVLVLFAGIPLLEAASSMALGSLSLGIIIYSLLSREYGLLVNIVSYVLSLARAIDPATLGYTFLVIAIIISLASGYLLISSEYRRYTREIYDGDGSGVPTVDHGLHRHGHGLALHLWDSIAVAGSRSLQESPWLPKGAASRSTRTAGDECIEVDRG